MDDDERAMYCSTGYAHGWVGLTIGFRGYQLGGDKESLRAVIKQR